ncbi:MAG: alpha/beta hydrolase [Bacteroidales bacterium]|nr:alpha/beta hydrolase [Bacteroidales bacterium]
MELTTQWDKTFAKSDKVNHKKVTFRNQYGITLVGDLYEPTGASYGLPAIAVSGPFGACKEQASGLYAHELAQRGYVTLAFDPSFTGESEGTPRRTASPDINTEDFMAAVDFLSLYKRVDAERIGICGICGWGGIALNTAAIDTRIKATAAITMYDMTRVKTNGYFDADNNEATRYAARKHMSEQRTMAAGTQRTTQEGGLPEETPDNAPQFLKEYIAYYKTSRGYHPRSGNSNDGWHTFGTQAYFNSRFLRFTNEIRSAVLVMHGEKAHSRYFGEDAYKYLTEGQPNAGILPNAYSDNKELYIVADANHTDLYDGGPDGTRIPWDKLESFFNTYLK